MNWEFTVPGIPMSANSNSSSRRIDWINRVRLNATKNLPQEGFPLIGDVSVQVVFFHSGPTNVDVDNILKRIIDGLYPEVMYDDRQVQDASSSRRDMSRVDAFINPPDIILPALIDGQPFVYIRVAQAMPQEEMPWTGTWR